VRGQESTTRRDGRKTAEDPRLQAEGSAATGCAGTRADRARDALQPCRGARVSSRTGRAGRIRSRQPFPAQSELWPELVQSAGRTPARSQPMVAALTSAPRWGTSTVARMTIRSGRGHTSRKRWRSRTAGRTARNSASANASPRHRRAPPPNGKYGAPAGVPCASGWDRTHRDREMPRFAVRQRAWAGDCRPGRQRVAGHVRGLGQLTQHRGRRRTQLQNLSDDRPPPVRVVPEPLGDQRRSSELTDDVGQRDRRGSCAAISTISS
jgi:hypothetical protein